MRTFAALLAALALSAAPPVTGAALEPLAAGASPATRIEFPANVTFEHEGHRYDLHVTGLAARRVAIF